MSLEIHRQGGAHRREAGMHLAADSPAVGARDQVVGQQSRLGTNLIEVFGDRQRVPHRHALMAQAGHEDRRRQQQDFGTRRRIFGRHQHFLELQAREPGQQPAAQRPGRIGLAADGQRGLRHHASSAPRASARCIVCSIGGGCRIAKHPCGARRGTSPRPHHATGSGAWPVEAPLAALPLPCLSCHSPRASGVPSSIIGGIYIAAHYDYMRRGAMPRRKSSNALSGLPDLRGHDAAGLLPGGYRRHADRRLSRRRRMRTVEIRPRRLRGAGAGPPDPLPAAVRHS
ncbi:hypothetical protein D3C81_1447850 [compost metagenome]